MPIESGVDVLSNDLMAALLAGKSFPLPTVDLDDPIYDIPADTGPIFEAVTKLDNAALTERTVGGNGTFDALMEGFDKHLLREFESGRITGNEYAKAYVALTQGAMQAAVQFLLGKEQAYWQAVAAQITAQTARIGVVTAKVQHQIAKAQLQSVSYEAANQEAAYVTAKIKLASEDIGYRTAKFSLDNLLPLQETQLSTQVNNLVLEGQIQNFSLSTLLPKQASQLDKSISGTQLDNDVKTFNLSNILPQQLVLLGEQVEAQRAQTSDMRTDGTTPIAGVLGSQKALYSQQITSYQRDAEVKAAKLFTDAWITQKTIDEGLLPPTGFNNASLDTILTALKLNNNLD